MKKNTNNRCMTGRDTTINIMNAVFSKMVYTVTGEFGWAYF